MIDKKLLFLILHTCLFLQSSPAHAAYDAYPDEQGPYVSGAVSDSLSWPGENFEDYANGEVIECSSDRSSQEHFDVTAGCLQSKHLGKWRRGWVDDRVFRVIALGYDGEGRRIKWTNGRVKCRAYIKRWQQEDIPAWAGLHLFQRYRSSDDLYVASLRCDGTVTIKRKWNTKYSTLAQAVIDPATHGDLLDGNGNLKSGRWINLSFVADGRLLRFFVDGTELLSVSSGTFSWGTVGIRLDRVDAYIDDWQLLPLKD